MPPMISENLEGARLPAPFYRQGADNSGSPQGGFCLVG